MKRRYEFVGGNSAKYYEIAVQDSRVLICFGRIGTGGQTQTKAFPDNAAATAHAEKLIKEKLGKGYVECQPV